jgi:segregation and condensation protein B
MDNKNLVEVLLFANNEPLTQSKLNHILFDGESIDLAETVKLINEEYKSQNKGLFIEKIGGGYQLLSAPDYHLYIQRLLNKSKKVKLSNAALEALSIIAYKQPISRIEIESIRGVECGSVIKTLMEREVVTIKGRDEGVGRALLYGTTQRFLELFGLNHISDLPKLKEIDALISEGEVPIASDEIK